MHVFMYVCMWVWVYVYTCMCVCMYVYVYVYVYVCVCIYMYIYTHMYVCMCVCICMCSHTYVCISHIYMQIHTCIYVGNASSCFIRTHRLDKSFLNPPNVDLRKVPKIIGICVIVYMHVWDCTTSIIWIYIHLCEKKHGCVCIFIYTYADAHVDCTTSILRIHIHVYEEKHSCICILYLYLCMNMRGWAGILWTVMHVYVRTMCLYLRLHLSMYAWM